MTTVQLADICHARSGDKGRHCTVGLVAWDARIVATLIAQVTPARVSEHFGDLVRGAVRAYPMPNINAISFLLEDALDGGGVRSLRIDAQGKAMCEAMLRMEIDVPRELLAAITKRSWPVDGTGSADPPQRPADGRQ